MRISDWSSDVCSSDLVHWPAGSVVVPALAVHVAVLQLLGGGLAHVDDLDVEMQVLAGHRMVEGDVDHAHADLLDGHRARPEVVVKHNLHARRQALFAEVLLRHALDHAFALLAVGLGGRHLDGELLAGLAAFHRLLQPRDDVALAGPARTRLPSRRTPHRPDRTRIGWGKRGTYR